MEHVRPTPGVVIVRAAVMVVMTNRANGRDERGKDTKVNKRAKQPTQPRGGGDGGLHDDERRDERRGARRGVQFHPSRGQTI